MDARKEHEFYDQILWVVFLWPHSPIRPGRFGSFISSFSSSSVPPCDLESSRVPFNRAFTGAINTETGQDHSEKTETGFHFTQMLFTRIFRLAIFDAGGCFAFA